MNLCAAYARISFTCSSTDKSACFNPKMSICIQKRHPYTGNLKSETPGDSKKCLSHCGDVLAIQVLSMAQHDSGCECQLTPTSTAACAKMWHRSAWSCCHDVPIYSGVMCGQRGEADTCLKLCRCDNACHGRCLTVSHTIWVILAVQYWRCNGYYMCTSSWL